MRTALLVLFLIAGTTTAADWKPAPSPLMTKWGKQITADKTPWAEYPRPQMVRQRWSNLNGPWQLAIENKDTPAPTSFPRRILVPFPLESALSGVGSILQPDQRAWYRRTFTVPADWRTDRTWLRFGAVDWQARVLVNGKEVGTHRGGYDPFSFDITSALRADGEQELIVVVHDPTDSGTQPRGKQVQKPGGIWYTPTSGIWQTVWLEPVPALGIGRHHCIGAQLARQELISAFGGLLERYQGFTATPGHAPPSYTPSFFGRNIRELYVTLQPA